MTQYHRLTNLQFQGDWLVLTIDREEKKFLIREISPALAGASEGERNNFEISPSGYGIHWPLLDEDLSVDGLLGIIHAPDFQKKSA
jgi:hypothetical protein